VGTAQSAGQLQQARHIQHEHDSVYSALLEALMTKLACQADAHWHCLLGNQLAFGGILDNGRQTESIVLMAALSL
jgi:hypothetical protein